MRLKREAPVTRQAGLAVAIGVALSALGGAMLALQRVVQPGASDWLVAIVGGGFVLVGLIAFAVGVKMLLMARLPETAVEVDGLPIRAGTPFQVTVRQPGPIRLESLRLNVVGEQITTRWVSRKGQREKDTHRQLVHQHNAIDIKDITVARGAEAVYYAETTVPVAVSWAEREGTKALVWRLEIWGRVRGAVDFGHPFVIDVRGGPQPPPDNRQSD